MSYEVIINVSGTVAVEANSGEEAIKIVENMPFDEMIIEDMELLEVCAAFIREVEL